MSFVTDANPCASYRSLRIAEIRPKLAKEEDPRKFLPEVQGLRAVAVLMVVTCHVWFGRISGGVDIFLLISAFLLTGQFTRKLESGRALDLFRYWFLASEAVDYYAADHSTASPLQHFWCLSIQGQVFILWPRVFAMGAAVSQKAKRKIRPLLVYIFGGIFVVSLVFSIMSTNSNQAFAYFDTGTRLWEFVLGSLLALVLPYLSFKRPQGLPWGGLAWLECSPAA